MARKSVWKSKSFLTGLVTLITVIVTGYGIIIPPEVIEGIMAIVGIILVGKSVTKRMK